MSPGGGARSRPSPYQPVAASVVRPVRPLPCDPTDGSSTRPRVSVRMRGGRDGRTMEGPCSAVEDGSTASMDRARRIERVIERDRHRTGSGRYGWRGTATISIGQSRMALEVASPADRKNGRGQPGWCACTRAWGRNQQRNRAEVGSVPLCLSRAVRSTRSDRTSTIAVRCIIAWHAASPSLPESSHAVGFSTSVMRSQRRPPARTHRRSSAPSQERRQSVRKSVWRFATRRYRHLPTA